MVRGVLSSCEARNVNSRMRRKESERRLAISLKTAVSRSSSSPVPLRGNCTSRLLSFICSAALVSATTGLIALRMSHQPPASPRIAAGIPIQSAFSVKSSIISSGPSSSSFSLATLFFCFVFVASFSCFNFRSCSSCRAIRARRVRPTSRYSSTVQSSSEAKSTHTYQSMSFHRVVMARLSSRNPPRGHCGGAAA